MKKYIFNFYMLKQQNGTQNNLDQMVPTLTEILSSSFHSSNDNA
jgi:hypothetical protein